ncbi:hypothetical protein Ahy_B05g076087 [Arachis hypogaea]|uniref:Aminotransferase-like plant mobile domain-containing protein n=1 Tax=Arachis hypogaea TaxID=3818 RepID=A0A444Z2J4_ARAHY|nr:hypothetical protein Ahy_B05g076087 [Arachis hypogaea]
MPLHDRIIPYLERAGLYHLSRFNMSWFWLDELLDATYQLGLPVDEKVVSGCLIDFEKLMDDGKLVWEWFQELFGKLPPPDKVKQFTFHFTWFHERFRVLQADTTKDTICIYARVYIIMLLSTQLFGDKSANWATYLPTSNRKEQRIIQFCLALDGLGGRDIVWERYVGLDMFAVVHPEILAEEHNQLCRAVTSLIYFAVIEWHHVDRVFPQLGGIQHVPEPALNIDWLHGKDDRGGNRWFPGPLGEFLDWWYRVAHRFLSPDALFANSRAKEILDDAIQRGSSQAPARVPVPDVPDNRRVERRRRIGT